MASVTKSTNGAQSPFFDFLAKYWIVVLGLIVSVPFLLRYIKAQLSGIQNDTVRAEAHEVQVQNDLKKALYSNTANQTAAATSITIDAKASAMAKQIATYLKVNGAWYDLFSWFPQAHSAFTIFDKQMKPSQLPVVARLYNEVYAIGRDLMSDCQRFMSAEDFNKINWSTYTFKN